MDSVAEIWAPDVDVTEMTDTDLVSSRNENTNVSDPEYELHQLCKTAMEHFDFPDTSFTLDYALRVELARLIDSDDVSLKRRLHGGFQCSRREHCLRLFATRTVKFSTRSHSSDELSFGREDFDVKYTIPQVGWFDQQEYETVELVPMDDVDTEKRPINFSMPKVVFNMAARTVEESEYETMSELVIGGLRTITGQR